MLGKNIIDVVTDCLHALGNAEQGKQCQRRRIVAVLLNIQQPHEELTEILVNTRSVRESIS